MALTITASSPARSTIILTNDFDALNRVKETVASITVHGFSTFKCRIVYACDAVGNLTNRTVTGLSGFARVLRSDFQYDMMNRLTRLTAPVKGSVNSIIV